MATLTIRQDQEKAAGRLTIGLSIAIPLAVMALLGLPKKLPLGDWTRALPHVIAVINTLTSIAIVVGVVAIKQKKVALHRAAMQSAFGLGSGFLIAYVLYHLTNESTKYGGVGPIRGVYFFVLFSHIFLSIGVVPLVLRAMFFALSNQVARHRAVVRWAAPLWLYVSVTGVIAYAMIRPFYRLSVSFLEGRRPSPRLAEPIGAPLLGIGAPAPSPLPAPPLTPGRRRPKVCHMAQPAASDPCISARTGSQSCDGTPLA